jgi:biotin synthase-related radical SAM superfamily protein
MKNYLCYIKKEDRLEYYYHNKIITVSETELDLLIEGQEVQGYKMDQIEMITTKEEENSNTCAYSGLPSLTEYNKPII